MALAMGEEGVGGGGQIRAPSCAAHLRQEAQLLAAHRANAHVVLRCVPHAGTEQGAAADHSGIWRVHAVNRAHTAVYGKAKYDVVDVSGVGVPKSVNSIGPCIDKNVLAANKTGLDKPRSAGSTAATIDGQVQPIGPLIKKLNNCKQMKPSLRYVANQQGLIAPCTPFLHWGERKVFVDCAQRANSGALRGPRGKKYFLEQVTKLFNERVVDRVVGITKGTLTNTDYPAMFFKTFRHIERHYYDHTATSPPPKCST